MGVLHTRRWAYTAYTASVACKQSTNTCYGAYYPWPEQRQVWHGMAIGLPDPGIPWVLSTFIFWNGIIILAPTRKSADLSIAMLVFLGHPILKKSRLWAKRNTDSDVWTFSRTRKMYPSKWTCHICVDNILTSFFTKKKVTCSFGCDCIQLVTIFLTHYFHLNPKFQVAIRSNYLR